MLERRGSSIQSQPKQSEAPSRLDEIGVVDGLANVAVGSESVAAGNVLLLLRGGHDDNWKRARPGILPQPAQHLEAVEKGEVQIEQHDGWCFATRSDEGSRHEEVIECFDPVPGHNDLTMNTGLLECPNGQLGVVWIVLHEQNCLRLQWLCPEMTSVSKVA